MESVSKTGGEISTSAVLAIVGGALMLAGGVLALSIFSVWSQSGMPGWGGMMGPGGGWGMMSGGSMWAAAGTMSAISIVSGAVSIAGGYLIYKKPESAGKWSIAILISGIVGLVGMSGFFIGPVLAIIGGIFGLAKK